MEVQVPSKEVALVKLEMEINRVVPLVNKDLEPLSLVLMKAHLLATTVMSSTGTIFVGLHILIKLNLFGVL